MNKRTAATVAIAIPAVIAVAVVWVQLTSKPVLKASMPAPVPPAAEIPDKQDKWKVDRSRSKMDDSETVTLSLRAETPISAWPGKTIFPTLIIRCLEQKTAAYVVTETSAHNERGGGFTVRLRTDSDPLWTATWSESTDNEALFSGNPLQLAKKLESAETLLFEFTPFNSSPAQTRFDVRGLNDHLSDVAKACNWK